jgi:hypothetical protein
MHDGQSCPEFIQKMMNTPAVLRARAEIRRSIAAQDQSWGDTHAVWRNLQIAEEYEARARAQGG